MRALALSGGGARIHYHAGALQHLLAELRREYQIVTGVSAGAIAAAYIAQFPVGQEAQASDAFSTAVLSLNERSVFRPWPLGRLQGLWKQSFYDGKPLHKTLRSLLCEEQIRNSGRKLRVGAVCVQSGRFQLFTEKTPDIVSAVLASAAFPSVLQPVSIEGNLWFDGGVRVVTPIGAAIEAGADEVDIIMSSPLGYEAKQAGDTLTALGMAMRAIDFMASEIVEKDLKLARYTNVLVANGASHKRTVKLNVIRPAADLGDTFDFSRDRGIFMYEEGTKDARRAILSAE